MKKLVQNSNGNKKRERENENEREKMESFRLMDAEKNIENDTGRKNE